MIDRKQVVEAARACIGTPFYHCGRQPGKGLDCIGLLVAAYTNLRLTDYDVKSYSRIVPPGFTRTCLSEVFDVYLPTAQILPGDVLLFSIRNIEQHVGIATDPGFMVHAYQGVRKVVEQRLDDEWLERLTGIFKYRGPLWQL